MERWTEGRTYPQREFRISEFQIPARKLLISVRIVDLVVTPWAGKCDSVGGVCDATCFRVTSHLSSPAMNQSRTVEQQPNASGFAKAGELIEITGAGNAQLTLHDRVLLTLRYEHAGAKIADDVEHEVALAPMRHKIGAHSSNDRIRDSLKRLAAVVVEVAETDGRGKPAIRLTKLIDEPQITADETDPAAILRYSMTKTMRRILGNSGRWGRIKAEVICEMTSKYAVALYELVQLRANLEKSVDTIKIDRFRQLLGVPEGKLTRGPDFVRRVIEPAELEVNALSDIGVKLEPVRKGARGAITAVSLAWWRKRDDEYRSVLRERQRPKRGRLARLRGSAEEIAPQ